MGPRERAVARIYRDAMMALARGAGSDAVMAALPSRDAHRIARELPWSDFAERLGRSTQPIAEAMARGTRGSGVGFVLDQKDPRVLTWAQQFAGQRVVQIEGATRDAVRQTVTRSISRGDDVHTMARHLRSTIGLHDRWAQAVERRYTSTVDRMVQRGVSRSDAIARATRDAERYHDKLVRARARNIARTETMTAQNKARQLSWEEARRDDLFDKADMQKAWNAANVNVCPICQDLNGVRVEYDDAFPIGVDMPPAHPSCRCTAVLVPRRSSL